MALEVNPKKRKLSLGVITGVTATGKTQLALAVVEYFRRKGIPSEIICCDSMVVYRHLDIGTAKPSIEIQKSVPHHLINLVEPHESFSVGQYVQLARNTIEAIHARGAFPILVGGTGLYLRGLLKGILPLPQIDNEKSQVFRTQLTAEAQKSGNCRAQYEELRRIDPKSGKQIHPNDLFRIIRALEVYHFTGKLFSELQDQHGFKENAFQTVQIALDWPRHHLYSRINQRIDQMIERGLEDEINALLKGGLGPQTRCFKGLAYRWLVACALGKVNRLAAIEYTKRDSRRFAKRQITWFRPLEEIHHLPGELPLDFLAKRSTDLFQELMNQIPTNF